MEYTVNIIWDDDAGVWIAASVDIMGLTLESGSIDLLIERVRHAVPELLELNNQPIGGEGKLRFVLDLHERMHA